MQNTYTYIHKQKTKCILDLPLENDIFHVCIKLAKSLTLIFQENDQGLKYLFYLTMISFSWGRYLLRPGVP